MRTETARRVFFVFLLAALHSTSALAIDYPDLQKTEDQAFDRALVKELDKLKLTQAVADHRLSVTVVDITDPEAPRMAEVNGEEMMYAASLPKIAILLAAMQKINDGDLNLTPKLQQCLVRMIRRSSNADASYVYDLVGPAYMADLLESDRYKLYNKQTGGLWVGRPYNRGPVWKRDPLHNISHGASTYEVARFYYLLATDRLVSPESSEQMKDFLSKPAINHKFVAGLKKYPDAKILRKSGTWRTYHADSALVTRNGRQYIVVALANDPKGGQWLEQIALAADKIVFDFAERSAESSAKNQAKSSAKGDCTNSSETGATDRDASGSCDESATPESGAQQPS